MRVTALPLFLLLWPLSLGCASSPPPASSVSAAQATSSPGAAAPASGIEGMKGDIKQILCGPGSVIRLCFAVPSDEVCAASFEAAWPGCTQGVVLHDPETDADFPVGRKVGRCIGGAIVKGYATTPTAACKKAAAGGN